MAGLQLPNRIVMAPMTRARAPGDIANEMMATYYRQRAGAGLIISEGTPISREGQGYLYNPGIFASEQITGWRLTTDAVHQAGGRIFAQLWHVGRVSHTSIQQDGARPVSASTRRARGARAFGRNQLGEAAFLEPSPPRALSTGEVGRVVDDFARAAANAVFAGFDGIELHAANGYLFEQFINPAVNDRSDRYSAQSVENRLRFTLEVVEAVSARIGARRVGIRISPYGQISDMPLYPDIDQIYLDLGRELARKNIAYIHLMDQSGYRRDDMTLPVTDQLWSLIERLRAAFDTGALVVAGKQTRDSANRLVEECLVDLVAFGQPFIANPDLVERLRQGWPLSEPDRNTYYGGDSIGYTDYPTYEQAWI